MCLDYINRFTASHHAALTGTSEVVIGLIELECDINARDHKGSYEISYLNFVLKPLTWKDNSAVSCKMLYAIYHSQNEDRKFISSP